MDKKTIIIIGLFMLLFCAVFATASVFRVNAQNLSVHNVNTGLNYATIQGAINDPATGDGDTILVDPGTYSGWVVINKTLTLAGANAETTVIDGQGTADYLFHVIADNVAIVNFTLRNTNPVPTSYSPAIRIYNVESVTVKNSIITQAVYGVQIRNSNFTTVTDCRIYGTIIGIHVHEVSYNETIVGNTLETNSIAIDFASYESMFSRVFHNNFVNDTNDVTLQAINYFDDGYPSSGNYWSKYAGTDLNHGPSQDQPGSDGIGDTSYAPVNDRYPLMGNFSDFSIPSGLKTYQVDVTSNSTISSFQFFRTSRTIQFSVFGDSGTGFCRISIPYGLILPPYNVTVDGVQSPSDDLYDNGTFRWIYFTYSHTQHTVTIQSAASIHLQSPTELSPAYVHPGMSITVATVYTETSTLNLTIQVFNATNIIGSLTITNTSALENGTGVLRSDVVSLSGGATEGFYDVKVTLFNTEGISQEATEANSVVVDATSPTIGTVSQNPPANNVHAGDAPTVTVEVVDSLSGLKRITLSYSADNAPWTNVTMTNSLGNFYNATIQTFAYNANVTYIITAEDNANNTVTTQDLGYTFQYRVIPEFATTLILPLLMAVTLLAVAAYKKLRVHTTDIMA